MQGQNGAVGEWPVLLVDDDEDVLAVSRLAMKRFTAEGVPIGIYTARSKQEAIEILNKAYFGEGPDFAAAFLDVVMETDTAGLELCEYIRGVLKDKRIQIFIRSGQPGVAPEREVVDRYDINGYFTKAEMTEDKLYSVFRSAVRQVKAMGGLATVYLPADIHADLRAIAGRRGTGVTELVVDAVSREYSLGSRPARSAS